MGWLDNLAHLFGLGGGEPEQQPQQPQAGFDVGGFLGHLLGLNQQPPTPPPTSPSPQGLDQINQATGFNGTPVKLPTIPQPTDQAATQNINEATGFNNTPVRLPTPPAPAPAPSQPVAAQPKLNMDTLARAIIPGYGAAQDAGHIAGKIGDAAGNLEVPGTSPGDGMPNLKLSEIAAQIPDATSVALPGVAQLGHVISYPLETAQLEQMVKEGQISPAIALQQENEAAGKAGIGMNDSNGTVFRKVAAPVGLTTADILLAGLGPEMAGLGNWAKLGIGAATGAGYGALNTAARPDNPTGGDYAASTATGAATGAIASLAFMALQGLSDKLAGTTGFVKNQEQVIKSAQALGDDEAVKAAQEASNNNELRDVAKTSLQKQMESDTAQSQTNAEALKRGINQSGELSPADLEAHVQGVKNGNPVQNPVQYELPQVPEGDVRQPIINKQIAQSLIDEKGAQAHFALRNLSPEDLALFDKIGGTTTAESLSKQASDPEAFLKAAQRLQDYNNFTQAVDTATGGMTPYRQNYVRVIPDVSNEENLARFNDAAREQGYDAVKPGYQMPRLFDTRQEYLDRGIPFKNENIVQDLSQDIAQRRSNIGGQALANGLQQGFPDQVSTDGFGVDAQGREFVNPRIYNFAQNGTKASVSPDLFDKIKNLEPRGDNAPLVDLFDRANQAEKTSTLGGGLFHMLKTSGRFGFEQTSELNIPRFDQAAAVVANPEFADQYHQQMLDSGITEIKAQMGVTSHPLPDLGETSGGFSGKNPINAVKETTSTLIDFYKTETVRAAVESGKVDMTTPEGIKAAQALGDQINNAFGGRNEAALFNDPKTNILEKVLADPRLLKSEGRVLLAPDFTKGKIGTWISALSEGGPAGNYARRMLISEVVGTGLLTELGRKLTTGNWDSLGGVVQNTIIDPNIPLPYKGPNRKDANGDEIPDSGSKLVLRPPSTYLSEVGRPIFRATQGDTSELAHFGDAKLAPLLSTAIEAKTGKDFYGNDIYKDKNGNPANPLEVATNLVGSRLPIPIQQGIKVAQGKENLTSAILNEAGGRVGTAPDDPTKLYFDSLNKARGTLDYKQQANFDAIHKTEYDDNGNKLPLTADQMLTNANIRASNPDVMAAETAAARELADKTGKNLDPLYALTPDQQKAYERMQGTPYESADYKKLKDDNKDWMPLFEAARSKYFKDEGIQGSQNPNLPNFPNFPAATQAKMDSLQGMPDAKTKAQFISANPDVQAAFDAIAQYTNDKRTAQGYDAFAQRPKADGATQALLNEYNALPQHNGPNGTSPARSAWIRAHPNEYAQMTGFYNQIAAFNAGGPFGDGIGAGGGGSNVAPAKIATIAAGQSGTGGGSGFKPFTKYLKVGRVKIFGGHVAKGGGGSLRMAQGGGSGRRPGFSSPTKLAVSGVSGVSGGGMTPIKGLKFSAPPPTGFSKPPTKLRKPRYTHKAGKIRVSTT